MPISRVPRTYLYESIADQLQAYIVENRLQPADKLPSQQELCERLGVSRTSLREALRLLQMAGILETRDGEGIFVTDFSLTPLVHQASRYLLTHPSHTEEVTELLDVREPLELQAVALAADLVDETGLAAMRRILEQAEAKLRSGLQPVEESTTFHDAIFRATRNGVLMRLASAVTRLLFELQKAWFPAADPTGEWLERDYAEHVAIYEALRDGRKDDAVEAMSIHLANVRRLLASSEQRLQP